MHCRWSARAPCRSSRAAALPSSRNARRARSSTSRAPPRGGRWSAPRALRAMRDRPLARGCSAVCARLSCESRKVLHQHFMNMPESGAPCGGPPRLRIELGDRLLAARVRHESVFRRAGEAVNARRVVEVLDPEIDTQRVAETRLEDFDRSVADQRHVLRVDPVLEIPRSNRALDVIDEPPP